MISEVLPELTYWQESTGFEAVDLLPIISINHRLLLPWDSGELSKILTGSQFLPILNISELQLIFNILDR